MIKATKREMYEALLKNYDLNSEEVAFINHEIELLNKKNASRSDKPTATQIENQKLANDILDFIKGNPGATIKAITDAFDITSQKATPILTKMVNDGKVSKVVEKRIGYFTAI